MALRTRHRFAAGFTLIEMLVSFGIFAVITAYSAANYRTARQGDDLRNGAEVLASSIRRVQTMAVSGESVSACVGGSNGVTKACNTSTDCAGGTTCAKYLPAAYGIHLSIATGETKKSIIFADLNGNHLYDAGEAVRTDNLSAGRDVAMSALSPMTAAKVFDIVWESPKPTVYYNGVSSAAAIPGTITLQHAVTLKTRTVSVNRITGQVSTY